MGKDLYDNFPIAKEMFERANEYFRRITDVMFFGDELELMETKTLSLPYLFMKLYLL